MRAQLVATLWLLCELISTVEATRTGTTDHALSMLHNPISLKHRMWLTLCALHGWHKLDNMPTPFHLGRKVAHHSRSERKLAFRRMWWKFLFATFDSSIICLTKDRPGFTTLQAWCNTPKRERSSLFVHSLHPLHSWIVASNRSSLSFGRRISSLSVSSHMLRKAGWLVGPSTLFRESLTPSSWHVDIDWLSVCPHAFELGGPSSR